MLLHVNLRCVFLKWHLKLGHFLLTVSTGKDLLLALGKTNFLRSIYSP